MPIAASFRSRLVARELLYGAWSVIPSPLSVRLLAAVGLDYVVIDLQHGEATEADLPAMTSAIRLAGAAPVARVRHAHAADIGRALDLGCEGVIVPNVDSAVQARQVVGAVRYPPAGYRSAGGAPAAGEPFCLVMTELAAAVAELDATLAVDGVDGLYVGPRDLSLSLGCRLDLDDPVLNRSAARLGWPAPPRVSPSGCTPATAPPPAGTATPAVPSSPPAATRLRSPATPPPSSASPWPELGQAEEPRPPVTEYWLLRATTRPEQRLPADLAGRPQARPGRGRRPGSRRTDPASRHAAAGPCHRCWQRLRPCP